mgnify:CR=1 FL=1
MRLCLRTDLYVGVPVYFWPWVFWQLLQLDLWVEQTGRSVLGAVCKRTGEVFITFTADDPEEVRPWRDSDLQALLPNSPLLRATLSDLSYGAPGALSPVHVSGEAAIRNLLRDAWTKSLARRTTQSLWPEIPGRAALARDERSLRRLLSRAESSATIPANRSSARGDSSLRFLHPNRGPCLPTRWNRRGPACQLRQRPADRCTRSSDQSAKVARTARATGTLQPGHNAGHASGESCLSSV